MENPTQIWQRVQGRTDPDPEALLPMAARELEQAAACLCLSRQLTGGQTQTLRQLFRDAQARAACLKGMYTLITGSHPLVRVPPPRERQPEIALRWCYGQQMQAMAAYEARQADPEYGPIFARLAKQSKAHCRTILELLGKLP